MGLRARPLRARPLRARPLRARPLRARPLRWAALVGALLLATPLPARAAFEASDPAWEGTSELYALAKSVLGAERIVLVATLDYSELTPADGLLVVHPEAELDYDELSAFLRAGGRAAIADDFGRADAVLGRFQIRRIPAPLRPAHALRRNASLPIAVPAAQVVAGQEQGRHPVVANVQQVVTNHPAGLLHPNLTPVLEIPALGEPTVTLAATGIIAGRGRLFALADPSVFINLMLRYPGNRAFAQGVVEYLVEDDSWGPRRGRLYVVANRFRQKGHFGGGTSFGQELRDQATALLESVDSLHTDGFPPLVSQLLAALASLAAAAWTATTALKVYRQSTPRYASATSPLALAGVAGRAAVLGAPTTHRALVVLELRSALLEALADRAGLPPLTSAAEVLAAIERERLLGLDTQRVLRNVLAEMSRAEAAVSSSSGLRVSDRDVVRLRADVARILDEAGAARRSLA
ncbi:MAG: DUF4350 domain-containing protein [Polyangiaceae bacterium]|nr:DUF4350 domain-containing protein [Polyangiaceae bacterium]